MGTFDPFRSVFVDFDDSPNTSDVLEDVYAGEFIITTEEYADLIRKETLLEVVIDAAAHGAYLTPIIECIRRLTGFNNEKPKN